MRPMRESRGATLPGGGIPPDRAFRERHARVLATAKQAAQLWATLQQQQPIKKKLPPWDENTYFQNVQYTLFPLVSGVDTIVAASNPQRIGIIFQNISTGGTNTYVKPNAAVNGFAPDGHSLLSTTLPWALLQKDWYNLVSAEWHGVSQGGGGNLAVTEIVLRDLPPSP